MSEKPLPNTIQTSLSIFPLATTNKRTNYIKKRKFDDLTATKSVVKELLFPTEEFLLETSLDRITISHKKPKISKDKNIFEFMSSKITEFNVGKNTFSSKLKKTSRKKKKKYYIPKSTPSNIICEVKKELIIDYLPPNEYGVKLVTPFKLFPYQKASVQWMIDRETRKVINDNFVGSSSGFLLAMDMGLGKTLCIATLIMRNLNLQRKERSCTLYVCPKNLIGTVKYEFFKFYGDQIKVLIYHRDFLRSQYDNFFQKDITKYDVIITNYSTIVARFTSSGLLNKTKMKIGKEIDKNTEKSALDFCKFSWFRIILDESHEIRSKKTKRFKCIQSLNCSRRICMSGTPIHNTLRDMYHQLEFCGLHMTRGCKYDKKNLSNLNLFNMVRFVRHEDANTVKLPEKTIYKKYFNLSTEEKFLHNHYISTAKNIYNKIDDESGRGKGKKTLEALTSMIKVMQICSAPYLITSASKKESSSEDMMKIQPECVFPTDHNINNWILQRGSSAGIHSSKLTLFVNIVNNIQGKTVVFANFTSTLRLALDALVITQPDFKDHSVFGSRENNFG